MAQKSFVPLLALMIAQCMFLFCGVITAKLTPTVYGYTLAEKGDFTVIDVISVDLENGNLSTLCTTEMAHWGVTFSPCISALDSKNELLYMVPDPCCNSQILYIVDVVHGVTLTTIDPEVFGIKCLTVRPSTGELFAIMLQSDFNETLWTVSYSMGTVREMILPEHVLYCPATFDDNDMLVVFASTINGTALLLYINPNTGEIENKIPIVGCPFETQWGGGMDSFKYDPSDKAFYGLGVLSHEDYKNYTTIWTRIDSKTGVCSEHQLFKLNGNIYFGCSSYDPIERNLWYAQGPTFGGSNLIAINVDNNMVVSVLNTTHDLFAMEIDQK